mgnify:CR=1 FL=1
MARRDKKAPILTKKEEIPLDRTRKRLYNNSGHSSRTTADLIKSGGGNGPMKPRQPAHSGKVPIPAETQDEENPQSFHNAPSDHRRGVFSRFAKKKLIERKQNK